MMTAAKSNSPSASRGRAVALKTMERIGIEPMTSALQRRNGTPAGTDKYREIRLFGHSAPMPTG
jgi:hypothetical protein